MADTEYIASQLPERLWGELITLAEKYQRKGIELVVFGSFAKSTSRSTSDLDLAAVWTTAHSPELFTRLYRDVQDLPTVRKIDLIDLETVDQTFKDQILKDAVYLTDQETIHE